MTYQLRRLRLHGFIERLPRKHRYRVTGFGLRVALFYTRTYVSVLRPGLSQIVSAQPPGDTRLRSHFDRITEAAWFRAQLTRHNRKFLCYSPRKPPKKKRADL